MEDSDHRGIAPGRECGPPLEYGPKKLAGLAIASALGIRGRLFEGDSVEDGEIEYGREGGSVLDFSASVCRNDSVQQRRVAESSHS